MPAVRIPRRAFATALAVALLAACTRHHEPRCAFCGMRIDPASPWRADLVDAAGVTHSFDAPRCALLAWRTGKVSATTLRVQEFYDRAWRDGGELRFAIGSDVIGPMGADLVPVDPARAAKFRDDHHATDVRTLDEVTRPLLDRITASP